VIFRLLRCTYVVAVIALRVGVVFLEIAVPATTMPRPSY
jgi:hypothetical protein